MIASFVLKLFLAALAATPALALAWGLARIPGCGPTVRVRALRIAMLAPWLALAPIPAIWYVTLDATANPKTMPSFPILATFLSTVWIMGVGVVFVETVRAQRTWRAQIGALRGASSEWVEAVERECGRLGIRAPRVAFADVATPCIVGLLRPILVAPVGTEPNPSVLRHELAHLRRRDLVWSLFYRVTLAVFWFHPLVPRLDDEARLAHEIACDHEACPEDQRRQYAETLLQCATGASPALHAGFGAAEGLERRLRALYSRTGRVWSWVAPATMIVALIVAIGAGLRGYAYSSRPGEAIPVATKDEMTFFMGRALRP